MTRDEILQQKQAIEARHGAWNMHNLRLADDVYTTTAEDEGPYRRVRRVLQLAADAADRPLDQLRVLDLAAHEGQFGIEFALHGASVLAIEGREASVAKANFVKEVLGLSTYEAVVGDVRELSPEQHGTFDVVLCLGILYHLDTPDVFTFMERVARVCRRFALVDTNVSPKDKESYPWGGQAYWGIYADEHRGDANADEKTKATWDSLDNQRSFTLTRPSLFNLLRTVGFTSVSECHVPVAKFWQNRVMLLAVKGQPVEILSRPMAEPPGHDWPEDAGQQARDFFQQWPGHTADAGGRLGRLLPYRVQALLKRLRS